MYGSYGRTQHGQDYWVGYGKDAVRMARECAARCRREGLWDTATAWDRVAESCAADSTKPLRCNLPPGVVHYERHSKGTFGKPAGRMFDEDHG
jgi:hypothetical protein